MKMRRTPRRHPNWTHAGIQWVIASVMTRGSYFDEGDHDSKPDVAIMNRAFARKYFSH